MTQIRCCVLRVACCMLHAACCMRVATCIRCIHSIRTLMVSDQPGRIVAVFVVSPILAHKSFAYSDPFLGAFAAALFAWDLWWLLSAPPRTRTPLP